jgi:hypothetical protein
MRWIIVLVCSAAAAALPAGARAALYDLQPGQAFTVAGTREGCASHPGVGQPTLTCSLWGQTTRVIPGTLYVELGPTVADVFQRTLSGDAGLLREYVQPAQVEEVPPAPAVDSTVFVVAPGDAVSVDGTDLACVVAKRNGDLGVTCRKLELGTGLPLSTSVAVTLSETAVTATRIRADRSGSTTFAMAQPFLPSFRAVARIERGLGSAIKRLVAIRRSERGFTAARYDYARLGLLDVAHQIARDRFADGCLQLDDLMYAGFQIPRGHTRLLFVRRMRKIEGALCR